MTVTTAKDALLASLNYRGKVDLNYMAEVYNKSLLETDEIIKELVMWCSTIHKLALSLLTSICLVT